MRAKRKPPFLPRLGTVWPTLWVLSLMLILPLTYSPHALQKGQAIKQFFAYSISKSLSTSPSAILETRLPCTPPRVWVEEPPIFHEMAAWTLKILPDQSAALPIAVFLLLVVGILWLQLQVNQKFKQKLLALTVLAAYCPIFLRYSIQHLPDPLSTAFLTLGAASLASTSSGHPTAKYFRILPWLFFLAAVTTKALAIFAVAPILFWHFFLRGEKSTNAMKANLVSPKIYVRWGLTLVLLCLPFILWLVTIHELSVPNPFFVQKTTQWLENRHTGSLGILLDFHFYLRAFTWIAIKGVGLILIGPAVYGLVKIYRARKFTDLEGLLFFWSLGIIPYWLLVRQANVIHDYYTLPFAVPLAVLGTQRLLEFRPKWLVLALGSLHLIIGATSLTGMRIVPLQEGTDRPLRCEMENWEPEPPAI